MKDTFEELSDMFEELFPDADRLKLEEVQRRLDEQDADADALRDTAKPDDVAITLRDADASIWKRPESLQSLALTARPVGVFPCPSQNRTLEPRAHFVTRKCVDLSGPAGH
jgi:hypothetical protein